MCCASGTDNAIFWIVILMVPSVSVELITLISEVDDPSGVDSPAIELPFCDMLKLFIICPIDNPNPNGSSARKKSFS